ncbi:50S ribosomal protein L15 [bacterium]|nr:50S ribosomal protein L15 [bacterium]MCI0566091.1 50S ribosomal protein L15 [bacterium]MCI0679890.1 50S ribosomal protein L15 [bacterium]
MQIHELQRNTPLKKKKRIGRGATRGKTSGRGTKGQKARAGNRKRPEMRDVIKRMPKRRGFGKNRGRTVNDAVVRALPVNVGDIERVATAGDLVTAEWLREKGLVSFRRGSAAKVKILGNGTIAKKISVAGCAVSKAAREKIEKAGGTVN